MSTHAFSNPFRPFNPFLVSDESAPAVDATPAAGEGQYALVQSGPAVSADEVESHLDAIEVTVRWGTQVLSMKHLDGGESFFVGAGSELELPDGLVDGKHAIVSARDNATYACIPANASAVLTAKNASPVDIAGGQEIALPPNAKLLVTLGSDITIEIATVRAGKKIPVGFMSALATGAAAAIGLSFLGHAAIVASLAMFMPAMNADDAENQDRNQMLVMQKLMAASAERETDLQKNEQAGNDSRAGGDSQAGEKHKGPEGVAGTTASNNAKGRMAFQGQDDKPALSRKDELALAADFGMVGMIKTGAPKDAPATPWADEAKGTDPLNKMGHMWGDTIDDAFGYGVGLTGNGEGGGGTGEGVGLKNIGTVGGGNGGPGKGFGTCTDPTGKNCDGMGIGHGPGRGAYVPKNIQIREPNTTTNGRLPPEVIQRVVRQNFGRFRLCYENALRTNPGLNGRVVTKFVIDRNGQVSMAQDGGSDMPSQAVTQCIVRSFQSLSFPQPEGGIATVTYPLVLSPGE